MEEIPDPFTENESSVVIPDPQTKSTDLDIPDATPEEDHGAMDRFVEGIRHARIWADNAAIYLESEFPNNAENIAALENRTGDPSLSQKINFPSGRALGYMGVEIPEGATFSDVMGEDYLDITPQERRERILTARQMQTEKRSGVPLKEVDDSTAFQVGNFIGMIAKDPTSAMPIGQTYKAMSAIGGSIAATDYAFKSLAETGEVDLIELGAVGVAGAVLTPALAYGLRTAGKAVSSMVKAGAEKHADTIVTKMESEVTKRIADGMPPEVAIADTAEKLGIKMSDVQAAMATSKKGVFIPKTQEAAQDILSNAETITPRSFKPGTWLDDFIQPISTRIKNISEPVFGRLMQYEYKIRSDAHKMLMEAKPVFKAVKKLDPELRAAAHKYWQQNNIPMLKQVLQKHPDAVQALDSMQSTLGKLHKQQREHAFEDLGFIEDYLPRYVADYKSLAGKMGKDVPASIEKSISMAQERTGRPLSEAEKMDIYNTHIRGFPQQEVPHGLSRKRQVWAIPDDWLNHYMDMESAYTRYVHKAVQNIEKGKLFGKTLKIDKNTDTIDLEGTIGHFLRNEDLPAGALEEMQKLLQARFIAGEKPTKEFIQVAKNLGYTATLGNPVSAVTQIQDLFSTMYKQGVFNTVKAIAGKKNVKAADLGITDVAEELATSGLKTARALEKILKWSGFKAVDTFGKTVNLNAAFNKLSSKIKSPKGIQELEGKYGKMFEEEFPLVLEDLKDGIISDRVKTILFTELAELQPISKLELPVAYLESPKGRIFYMLKTFTLKQINLIRNDMVGQIAKGNVYEGTKNLVRYSTMLAAGGVTADSIKNLMQGKEMTHEDIPDMAAMNFWKTFAVSQYLINSVGYSDKDNFGQTAAKTGRLTTEFTKQQLNIPLLSIVDIIWKDMAKAMKKEDMFAAEGAPKDYKTLQYVPLGGRFLHAILGGSEKYAYEKRKEKERDINRRFE